jgi:hypothetical protein
MEMGNLSSREIEPDRAVAELFSHYGGGQQSRESGAEAVVEQSQHLAIAWAATFLRNERAYDARVTPA